MKLIVAAALALGVAFTVPTHAQDKKSADTNMQILRDKIKADKKLVVAANMDLTDAEAKKFWPIYDGYQKKLAGFNQRIAKLIVEYAEADTKGKMTDALAKKLVAQSNKIGRDEANALAAVSDKLAKVLPGRKLARYVQIENKIRAAIRYELAAEIPLVE